MTDRVGGSEHAERAPLRVFLNYRRQDTGGHALHLYADLVEHFGDESIFMDMRAIEPGLDFSDAIDAALEDCDVVLCLIGTQWLTLLADRDSEDTEDWVRLELEQALSRAVVRVIPVLVERASMPARRELPEALAPLARRNAFDLSNTHWPQDVEKLVAVLERVGAQKAESSAHAKEAEEAERQARENAERERRTRDEQLAREQAERERLDGERRAAEKEADRARVANERAAQARQADEEAEGARLAHEETERARVAKEEAEEARRAREEAEAPGAAPTMKTPAEAGEVAPAPVAPPARRTSLTLAGRSISRRRLVGAGAVLLAVLALGVAFAVAGLERDSDGRSALSVDTDTTEVQGTDTDTTGAPTQPVPSPVATHVAACTNVALGFVGPLSGPAAFVGKEQLSWLRFGVQKYNEEYGTRFEVKPGDTQLESSVARTVAQRFVADGDVWAIIPSESEAVRAGGDLFERANLAAISGTATGTDLTKGHPFTTFFRVVPNDSTQGPTIVEYVAGNLNAKNVLVIDSQDDYSVQLATAVAQGLERRGVDVSRESVSPDDTDFSSIVAKVEDSADVVVFATLAASAANTLSNQLRERGKEAILFATDGAYSPSLFKPDSGYVSGLAPDLHLDAKSRSLVRQYNRYSKNRPFYTNGPPTYMAGLVATNAVARACADGEATRAEVTKFVRRTNIASILGGAVRFSANGDPLSTKFVIYEITNKRYRRVG